MKKIISLALIIAMLAMMCTTAYAIPKTGLGDDNIKPVALDGASGTVNNVLGYMQWVGYAIAIGMLIFSGIKYVTAGAGEKAKVKETLVPIVIGAVLIAGATALASAIFTAVGN